MVRCKVPYEVPMTPDSLDLAALIDPTHLEQFFAASCALTSRARIPHALR
jgi:hypothetical protein